MDVRLAPAPVVPALASALDGVIVGLYVGGSLATCDYRRGVSDIDAVALVDRPPTAATRALLVDTHQRLARDIDGADALHCVYVSLRDAREVPRAHWTWAFGELFRRPLSGIARAELLADPIIVAGPHPSSWLSAMSPDALRDAARAELAGYWTRALRKRSIWLQDEYVDIGLTVCARAEATIKDGSLITKSEAIERLRARGLPGEIVEGVALRRHGRPTHLSEEERRDRATTVRHFLAGEIARLLGPDQ